MTKRNESINTFFDDNVYSPLRSSITFIVKEAAGVCSAIQGHVSPSDPHYYLRTAYSYVIGLVASVTIAPVFLALFTIHLSISFVLFIAAKVAQNAILLGLGIADFVSDIANKWNQPTVQHH